MTHRRYRRISVYTLAMGRLRKPGRVRFTGYAHADTLAALGALADEWGWNKADTLDHVLAVGLAASVGGLTLLPGADDDAAGGRP